MTNCVYLREEQAGRETEDGRQIYNCELHTQCTKTGDASPLASCEQCKQKLTCDDDNFADDFLDPLLITDSVREPTHALRNMLKGGSAFLVCGGPSSRKLDLSKLEQRGVWSLAVNNMAGHVRPQAFVCSDPPSKFHNGIWQDPSIIKFVPTPKTKPRRGRLRKKVDGEFKDLYIGEERINACDCPNVWGFQRRSWLSPDESFFLENGAAWGNHDAGTKRTGEKKTVNTSLLGLRLLYYLGARRIYLIGMDFWMDPNKDLKDNYAFRENRDASAIGTNNSQFTIANDWLCRMQSKDVFSKFGLDIYNCFERSGLRAFPYVPFDIAIDDCLKDFPTTPFDLNSWYFKKKKEKK